MSIDRSRMTMYLAAALIGLLPAWMILLPLDITGNPNGWQVFVRAHSLAVPLVELVFVLIVMAGFFSPIKSINQLPNITKIGLALWWIASCTVSFQAGKDPLLAIIGLARLAIAALFFLALVDLKRSSHFRFTPTMWLWLGAGTTLHIILWAVHILVVAPQGDDWVYRVPGVNNVRHTGHFAFASVIAGLVSLIAFRNNNKAWLRWLLPVMLGSQGLGLALWTGSRGPLLASLVAIFVTIGVAAGNRKTLTIFLVSSALVATVVVATLPIPHYIFGIAGATGLADMAQGASNPSSGRTILWANTIEKVLERPILGWGVNQFVKFGPTEPGSFFHPHNFLLQLMFSGGIVSIILMPVIFLPALRQWKWPDINGPSAAGVGGVIGILVYSMYDGAMYFSYPTMIFLIAITTSIAPSTPMPGQVLSD